MQRVGYDADTQTYTYRDQDGSYWEGDPGARYGLLHRSKLQSRANAVSINSRHLGGSDYQPKTRPRVYFASSLDYIQEELPSSANRPHKQLFGLLSDGYGKVLVTLSLIYTGMLKKVSYKKQKAQRQNKPHPKQHTPRRRRRPHKWHEK